MLEKSQILDEKKLKNLLNRAFVGSSSDILRGLLAYSVQQYMDRQKGKPKPLRLNIKSGKLARYIQNMSDIRQSGSNLEYDEIVAERQMAFPYLAIHEYGGTFPFRGGAFNFGGGLASQPAQKRAMFKRLTDEKEYDKSKAQKGQSKATYTMPSRTFLRLAIKDWAGNPNLLKPVLRKNIAEAFKNNKYTVVIR